MPTSATPLALNAGNAAKIAPLATGVGEAILTIAQFAVDSAGRFALHGSASPSTTTCPNGGLLIVTLTDRDGDGVASAGDRITVESRDCAVPVVTDVVAGTMQIDLGTPTGLPAGSLRAAVSLLDGLRFGSSTTATTKLLGSMQLDWSSTDAQTVLHVTGSAADDLRVVATNTGTGATSASLTESIRQPDLSKTLKYDEARAVISLSFRYESEALAGSIAVTTPTPLRAYLDTYPEIGRIEMTGASGSKVVVTPNFVNSSEQFQYALDSNGDGSIDSTGSVNWSDSVVGYLWWDGTTALSWSASNIYTARSFATTDFYASASFDWTTSSASSLRLQFSRPLASTTPTLYFRFADMGATVYDGSPIANIGAASTVQGALVVVSPTTPLRHGRNYMLQASLDNTSWYSTVTLQDALGNSTSSYQWTGLSVTTPDNLHAAAVVQSGLLLGATDQLLLSAQTSTGSPSPIVSFRWSQVSGTPLHFDDATAAQTQVAWGTAAPAGVEHAVVRLTVVDANGDTDAVDVTILSANLTGSNHVLYFRSAAGDYIGAGATALFDDGLAQFQQSMNAGYLSASVISPGYADWWYLALASSDGSALRVGAYENAIRAAFRGNQNGIDFDGDGRGCNQTTGRFDVLEIETDGAGVITRLAVDFEQHCESASAPALMGSYRVNSSIPIRR